ncbi:MAG: PorT family protein [Dysgonamonadaceae bacterium]|jgi:hypothetical protein|nr:PorT family protein [Dysgonamonadaceae bacterium]
MVINDVNRNKFDDVIKNKVENYSLLVDSNSWSEIEKRLNAKSRKRVIWTSISGIAVAAAIAAVWIIIPFNNKQIIYYDTTAEQQVPYHEKGITENVFEGKDEFFSKPPVSKIKSFLSRKEKIDKSTTISDLSDYNVTAQTKEPCPVDSLEKEEKKEWISLLEKNGETTVIKHYSQKKKKSNSLSLLAGSGSLLAINNSVLPHTSTLRAENISKNAPSYMKGDLLTPDDFEEITHFLPLSFGINFRKQINNYLFIESGLTYTYLYSKFKNKFPKHDAKLELHYLGIPVNLVVPIYRSRYSKWNIYTSAGGMVEKGLISHYKQNEYESENDKATCTISNEKIDGLQWSVHAVLGIDYKIVKNYSIYFEPKINYYLRNNQPFSFRTEHPLIIGINAGIRYTW